MVTPGKGEHYLPVEVEAEVGAKRMSCRLGRSLRANLQHLWGNCVLADFYVSLKSREEDGSLSTRSYAVHKTVLCTSGFFCEKLMGEWTDLTTGVVSPDDPLVDFEVFEAVLRSLYGFDVRMTTENVLGLVATAAYLEVRDVVDNCSKYLVSTLDRASFGELVVWCEAVWDRQFPCRGAVLDKCADVLSTGPMSFPLKTILKLPAEYLAQILRSDSTWLGDECMRLMLVVDLLLEARGWVEIGKEKCEKLEGALMGVLKHGIHYGCIPEERLLGAQSNLLKVLEKNEVLDCLKSHLWRTKEFHLMIRLLQPGGPGNSGRLRGANLNFGWLRMGGEWSGVDTMVSGEVRNLQKIYYGGSVWWLQLAYEVPGKDKMRDVKGYYGIFLMHEAPCVGKVAGLLVDHRDEIKTEIKITCVSEFGLLRRQAIWHVRRNYGWGWPRFLNQAKLHKFMLPRASLRVAFALRIITD